MKLIGVAGTNGSGKDTIGEILSKDYGWMTVSLSDFLREEAHKRNLPIEREVLRSISAEWRRRYGLGILVDKAVDKFNNSSKKYTGLVVVPPRNPGEAQRVKDLGGVLIWVDADPKVRYQRIYSRGRSDEDNKTLKQFLEEEEAEMNHSGDEATLSMSGVKAKADVFIENNGSDIDELKIKVKKALGLKN